jgi:hypothetical protein
MRAEHVLILLALLNLVVLALDAVFNIFSGLLGLA